MALPLDPTSLMAVLAGTGAYISLLPHLSDVRKASPDDDCGQDVKIGLIGATAALVGVGAIIAVFERNPQPLLLVIAIAGLMDGIFWLTLMHQGDVGLV